ncbi:MAG: hypothetical protein Q4G26_14300, partial [Paracoccus sp. (in: a-proteobacteria)]|nr:hypothetical protein [Paracoccus sp. (in: a-proteobacteria)]
MTSLKHVATLVSDRPQFTGNITDLAFVETAQGTILLSVSNTGAGLNAYLLGAVDDPARSVTREQFQSFGTYFSAPKMQVIAGPDDSYRIIVTGQGGSVHSSLLMTGGGNLRNDGPGFAPTAIAGDVVAMNVFDAGGQTYVLAGQDGSMDLQLYRMGTDMALTRLGSARPGGTMAVDAEYTDIEVVQIG